MNLSQKAYRTVAVVHWPTWLWTPVTTTSYTRQKLWRKLPFSWSQSRTKIVSSLSAGLSGMVQKLKTWNKTAAQLHVIITSWNGQYSSNSLTTLYTYEALPGPSVASLYDRKLQQAFNTHLWSSCCLECENHPYPTLYRRKLKLNVSRLEQKPPLICQI